MAQPPPQMLSGGWDIDLPRGGSTSGGERIHKATLHSQNDQQRHDERLMGDCHA
eukprot:CAMPEP_0184687038 /NCGR_PEP_ID=MMETSP0312-20130426/24943_1 /TAXON_ID=31354 /ORGANISM="Compsopogon coeruleus, Strain SAG 36.94" /LENGTH=53 /DNA_ID=CAMNT_0027142741 /DNA_START=1124 /DNA_END=1285 /DNA_ORIENTATION=+